MCLVQMCLVFVIKYGLILGVMVEVVMGPISEIHPSEFQVVALTLEQEWRYDCGHPGMSGVLGGHS